MFLSEVTKKGCPIYPFLGIYSISVLIIHFSKLSSKWADFWKGLQDELNWLHLLFFLKLIKMYV